MAEAKNLVSLVKSEHVSSEDTGDNVSAKRVVNYSWDGSNWQRFPTGLIDKPADTITLSNYDANGIPGTIVYSNNSITQRTLTLSVDGSGNITSIVRT